MPTDKQSAASRANSQNSTGPRTAEGKAKSRFNALKHGIFAESHIIFDESAEALDDLAAEYRERFNAADAAERCLVDVLIDSEWRLRRLRRVEAQTWAKMNRELLDHRRNFAKHPAEVVAPTAGEVFCGDADKFTAIQKAIGACQRDYRQTLKELRTLVAQGHALRTEASATDIPVCRPATDIQVPEPEETKPTSEPSASFPNNPPAPFPAHPEPPPILVVEVEPSPAASPDPIPSLPEAA
jgi:hypothetical protein